MNTVKSFWAGWGALCVAGGGAYYFAKKSINADRMSRLEEQRKKREMIQNLEQNEGRTSPQAAAADPARVDTAGSPSQESSSDPAPTRHAPATEGQRVTEKSKYENTATFRPPRGDRFS